MMMFYVCRLASLSHALLGALDPAQFLGIVLHRVVHTLSTNQQMRSMTWYAKLFVNAFNAAIAVGVLLKYSVGDLELMRVSPVV